MDKYLTENDLMINQKLGVLKKDIGNARNKLLHTATTPPIKKDDDVGDMSENRRKQEVRTLRNILKDKLTTYDLIMRAKELEAV